MKINEVATLYKNLFEEGTAKGSFFITDNGLMTPRTRNVTLWGLANSLSIPEEYRQNPNIVTALKNKLSDSPETPLPAFFKFQKTPTSIFTEAVAMEIATHFATKTCFNYPANLDKSPCSLYQSVSPYIDTKTNYGNMIFSFLARDEELITFYKISNSQEMTTDVMTLTELVPQFVAKNLPDLTPKQASRTISNIQKDYAYQYLLRDYLGDIDFTSKNSGIILNRELGYATIAPNFDYGEVMNPLITTKFTPPELDSIDKYPEVSRRYVSQEMIDRINASKLERYNAPISQVAQENTFGSNSEINIHFICTTFPDVAQRFKDDLQSFIANGLISQIIGKYIGDDNLVSEEQGSMCIDYLTERSAIFDEKLEDSLSYVPSELRYYYDDDDEFEYEDDKLIQNNPSQYVGTKLPSQENNSSQYRTEQEDVQQDETIKQEFAHTLLNSQQNNAQDFNGINQ